MTEGQHYRRFTGWNPLSFRFLPANDLRERADVIFHRFRDGLVVNELAFAAAFDEAGVGQGFQVVGNRGGSDSLQRGDIAAIHVVARGDGLVDHEASLIAESFRDTFDLVTIHRTAISSQEKTKTRAEAPSLIRNASTRVEAPLFPDTQTINLDASE